MDNRMGAGMNISLILPYWDRQQAADKALHLLAQTYRDLPGLEIIVVDDGNAVPFVVPDLPLNIKVVRLPEKDHPTPQSRAWNAGVRAASNEIVVLSCVEVLHRDNVLGPMFWELGKQGRDGYVLAAAWCPDERRWHCRSTEQIPHCPPGTGPAFCGMLSKSLFWMAGGFDENYHDGAGYEDKDFIHRLTAVGAKFIIRDDLIVIHPKTGAKINWPAAGFVRNADLFFDKWFDPVEFVCLKAGTAYGPEYVNILHDMVQRNLPEGFAGRFWCITDDPTDLHPAIRTIPLPDDLETWWGKLYMFKPGLFRRGARCCFMDLDTLIVGRLDEIVGYHGQFATLRDFYHPQQVGPAVILWRAGGVASSIWEEWEAEQKPRHVMGDLWWINNLDQGRFARHCDKLQDLFPGQFVSFKADCHPYAPQSARIVCFHGQPKPDNCATDWVAQVWKVGGLTQASLEAVANTAREEVSRNVLAACARPLPWLEFAQPHTGQAVIIGGGPSLASTLPEIIFRKGLGQTLIACNGAAAWLNKHGITPDVQIIIDARPDNARFIKDAKAGRYWLASQCDPAVFDAAGESTTLIHMNTEGMAEILPKDRPANLISSGTTVGLAAMAVAYVLGYRYLHLYGMDSSHEGQHHAYEQTQNDADAVVDVSVNGERFKAAPWMVRQVQDFQTLANALAEDGVVITVAGTGLLPFVARCMSSTPLQDKEHDRNSPSPAPVH